MPYTTLARLARFDNRTHHRVRNREEALDSGSLDLDEPFACPACGECYAFEAECSRCEVMVLRRDECPGVAECRLSHPHAA